MKSRADCGSNCHLGEGERGKGGGGEGGEGEDGGQEKGNGGATRCRLPYKSSRMEILEGANGIKSMTNHSPSQCTPSLSRLVRCHNLMFPWLNKRSAQLSSAQPRATVLLLILLPLLKVLVHTLGGKVECAPKSNKYVSTLPQAKPHHPFPGSSCSNLNAQRVDSVPVMTLISTWIPLSPAEPMQATKISNQAFLPYYHPHYALEPSSFHPYGCR